jgi:hypothetical protein
MLLLWICVSVCCICSVEAGNSAASQSHYLSHHSQTGEGHNHVKASQLFTIPPTTTTNDASPSSLLVATSISTSVVDVTSTSDTSMYNASNCAPGAAAQAVNCTLRSAVQYCSSLLAWPNLCHIHLPQAARIELNASLGELALGAVSVNLRISGRGSTVAHSSHASEERMGLRFVSIIQQDSVTIDFHLEDISLNDFYVSQKNEGGDLKVDGGGDIVLENVSFDGNEGYNGGSIFVTNTKSLTILHGTVTNSEAWNSGGGIFLQDVRSRRRDVYQRLPNNPF